MSVLGFLGLVTRVIDSPIDLLRKAYKVRLLRPFFFRPTLFLPPRKTMPMRSAVSDYPGRRADRFRRVPPPALCLLFALTCDMRLPSSPLPSLLSSLLLSS